MRSQNFQSNNPLLYLVATPIGNLQELSPRAVEVLSNSDIIACEDTRNTAKLLQFFNISKPLISLREHNEVTAANALINDIKNGKKVAYCSDAGYPCISDPGNKLVKIALENNINVATVSGPNAALNALVSSGLETTHYLFYGFLDVRETAAKKQLEDLVNEQHTLIFYESPHRIASTLKILQSVLGNRQICIARELTKIHEEFIRTTLDEAIKIDPTTLKGEMVIIVEGNNNKKDINISDDDLIMLVNVYIKNGLSKKDAIKKVSSITKINKNIIYDLVH